MKHNFMIEEGPCDHLAEDVAPEYDFDRMPLVRRGLPPELRAVTLDPDTAAVFPDAQAVNEALRTLIRLTREMKSAA